VSKLSITVEVRFPSPASISANLSAFDPVRAEVSKHERIRQRDSFKREHQGRVDGVRRPVVGSGAEVATGAGYLTVTARLHVPEEGLPEPDGRPLPSRSPQPQRSKQETKRS
jgi:hypothetical protein